MLFPTPQRNRWYTCYDLQRCRRHCSKHLVPVKNHSLCFSILFICLFIHRPSAKLVSHTEVLSDLLHIDRSHLATLASDIRHELWWKSHSFFSFFCRRVEMVRNSPFRPGTVPRSLIYLWGVTSVPLILNLTLFAFLPPFGITASVYLVASCEELIWSHPSNLICTEYQKPLVAFQYYGENRLKKPIVFKYFPESSFTIAP